ncbi:MAG: hypothetical protein KME49_26090 [Brasilonema octagenarum HA4186-MV1]|nr:MULTISPECIES: hypothetical protein [Brasilonema]MBW4628888.1 hypothetical protein [Brasilonema octagenarum HA4186-MV1]
MNSKQLPGNWLSMADATPDGYRSLKDILEGLWHSRSLEDIKPPLTNRF